MARLVRVVVPGLPHHVTQRGNRRQRTSFGEADYRAYRALVAVALSKTRVACWDYCLMRNHVHLILMPEAAFYRSALADNKSFEQWSDEGGRWHQERAAKLWRKMLADYQPPPMDEAVDGALQAYMAKRREEIGRGA